MHCLVIQLVWLMKEINY